MHEFLAKLVPCLLFLAPFALFLLWAYFNERENERLGAAWEPVMEGDLDYVVYGEFDYVVRAGTGMTRRYEKLVMKTTAIHFSDGRACVVNGRHDMPFPAGTRIRVMRNGLGVRRIEQA